MENPREFQVSTLIPPVPVPVPNIRLPFMPEDPTAVSGLSEIFWTSKAVHVSILDFCVLSAAVVDPLREDMRRRGWEPEATKVALFAVPLVGPTLWLAVRPPVVRP